MVKIRKVMELRSEWNRQDFIDSYSDEWDSIPATLDECFEVMEGYLRTYDESLLDEIIENGGY